MLIYVNWMIRRNSGLAIQGHSNDRLVLRCNNAIFGVTSVQFDFKLVIDNETGVGIRQISERNTFEARSST